MAKRPATQSETDTMNDSLADLGLDIDGASDDVAAIETVTQEAPVSDNEYNFGEIQIGTATEVPTTTRAGGGSSRFPFAKLDAPTEKNGKPVIATFTVPFAGGDEGKFKRAVQSATTQANRSGKDEGKYFESRSVTEGGKLVAMQVFRTDNRPAADDAAE